jgi:hypothetical protein
VSIPPETQLAWFLTALEELPAFLPSGDVFRPLHHPPPRMVHDLSLGTMLLTIDSLTAGAEELTPAERAAWDRARLRWGAEVSSRAAAVEGKARAELPHRLNLWRSFLQDLAEKSSESERYAGEVRHRVIIERLAELSGALPDVGLGRRVAEADQALRSRFEPGAFIWDAPLAALYPQTGFWFLYGRPAKPAAR